MLVLSGIELAFLTVAGMGLYFRFLLNTGLIKDVFVIAEQLITDQVSKEAVGGRSLLATDVGIKHYCTEVERILQHLPPLLHR